MISVRCWWGRQRWLSPKIVARCDNIVSLLDGDGNDVQLEFLKSFRFSFPVCELYLSESPDLMF